ncbi:MAG: amino acid ABC transporter permease [Leptolyngbya sp. IPPAS B-1204]|nr:ABC transporter permease subunit [Elainella sp. C42_A2020_010]RNJ68932.1 MAG: ABC transporter permease subunit [Leptolyngbya sp. IPPAS B-1204]
MDEHKVPLWRDDRFLKIALQVIVLAIVVALLALLGGNALINLRRLGIPPGYDFLNNPASFGIGDTAIPYSPTDSFGRALLVGLVNTLRVIVLGIILATILGIVVGIARLSENWLVRQIATIYVEIFRNTPLLLQLFFLYTAVFLRFPAVENSIRLPGPTFLSNQGIFLLWPAGTARTWIALAVIIGSLILGILFWRQRVKVIVLQGASGQNYFFAMIALAVIAVLALLFGLDWQAPVLQGDVVTGGLNLSGEFGALLAGLVLYTAAFIAEVVRAGIQSVSKGQWEASRALGLQPGLAMRLVIFPQALRVMIPPLTSEYLNLAKNSSLAAGIAYADFFQVANTINNQTGRVLQVVSLIMITYLTINLIISLAMNWFNQQVQIKER